MRVVCITGMHRSGTSLVSRVINLLGVHLGPDEDLMEPKPENPKGFWESLSITRINDDLLAHLGGRWDRPPLLRDGWEGAADLEPFRRRAGEVLRDHFAGAAVAGWKDPRMSLLLPFWRTVTSVDSTILSLREPMEVARSMHARSGMDSEQAAYLWLRYVLAAMHHDPDHLLVRYEDFFEDLDATVARIAAHLSLPAPGADTRAAISGFFDPALRRQRGGDAPSGPLLALAGDVFTALSEVPAATRRPLLEAVWRGLLDRQEAEALADQLEGERAAFNRTRDGLLQWQAQAEAAQAHLEQRTGDLRLAEQRAARLEQELERLRSRRSVRLALRAAQVTRPAVQTVRRLRRDRQPDGASRGTGHGGKKQPSRRAGAEEGEELARLLRADSAPPPAGPRPKVSVVILNRSGEHHLRACLPALEQTDYKDLEVVVVDNASSDGSIDYLQTVQPRFGLQVLRNSENRSFSEANNEGIAAASGELVLLLNNDVVPVVDSWLARMVDTLYARGAGAVGARLVYPPRPASATAAHDDLTLQHRGLHFTLDTGAALARNLGAGEDPRGPAAGATVAVPGVTAACMLVRRDVFDQVGGFSTGYVYGTEDIDLCCKIRAAGYEIVYEGRAVLWHHEYGTQDTDAPHKTHMRRTFNRDLFLDRWGPRIYREVLADKVHGHGAWSTEPLHVMITLTRDDPAAGWGDWYTAHELGDTLQALGWRVSYGERYRDRWYDPAADVDVVVALLDAFDVHRVPEHVVKVAWVRNWTDRWLARPWFDDFDVVLASSGRSAELITAASAQHPRLLPLATNPHRFRPCEPDPDLAVDLLFVGNYWDEPRGLAEALPALPAGVSVKVYGAGWEKVRAVRPLHRGTLDYRRLPTAYSSARLVLDDTAGPTRRYGAVNARVFDALAAGALVVSDNPEGVGELFDEEFPTYDDGASLAATVKRLLAEPDAARALAARYRQRVLSEHTYERRAGQLRDLLQGWGASLRFGICAGVPDRAQAPSWGDYHYARALQRELRRRGHPTRVYLLPEWSQPHTSHADVLIHLFGLSELPTRSSQLNVLWVISHPERVSPQLCERYDLVCVASDRFAEHLAGRVSVPVMALHQATDPTVFAPRAGGPHHQLLFVANSRRTRRPILDDLLPTAYDLAVYGRDWTADLVDRHHLRGEHIPNRELAAYYAAADVVLNDHWPDMRRWGFLSNRLYDALTAGAFVVSDHVEGIDEEFDRAVVTYRSADELRLLLDRFMADPDARRAHAERGRQAVLNRHTFAHRVDELLRRLDAQLQARPRRVVEDGARAAAAGALYTLQPDAAARVARPQR